jgi:hypothetical protein
VFKQPTVFAVGVDGRHKGQTKAVGRYKGALGGCGALRGDRAQREIQSVTGCSSATIAEVAKRLKQAA